MIWDKWHDWLDHHQISAIQACLAFPLSFVEFDRIVVGADSTIQLAQIIKAAQSSLPVELPDLNCEDISLINPSLWPTL